MKVAGILPFVALTSALVLPVENLRDIEILEDAERWMGECYDEGVTVGRNAWSAVHDSFSKAFETTTDEIQDLKTDLFNTASDVQTWASEELDEIYESFSNAVEPVEEVAGGHRPGPNQTVYQIIASNPYSTKLAALINEFDDLVKALNSTKANYTVFAPTDKAFDKVPKNAPKPSKEQLKNLLSYHVIPDLYPAGRVLFAHTGPTLLKSDSLGSKPQPQRLAFRLGWKGVTVNFYSAVIAPNIFATNGVIHAIDTPLLPPIGAIREIDLFPGAFSTLELGLAKTGLLDKLNTTDHNGGTLFAPNNGAFEKLGPKANAFLFSRYGLKFLKALLEYHIAPENTLYSDAFYKGSGDDSDEMNATGRSVHVDLPTALKDRSLSIDIARYGPFYDMKINGFTRVAVQDVVAEDGVIHVLKEVIIPPKKLPGGHFEMWQGGEVSVEELMERLYPFVDVKGDL